MNQGTQITPRPTQWPDIFERDVCPIPRPNVLSMNIMFAHKNSNIEELFGADTPAGRYNRRRVLSHSTVYSGMSAESDISSNNDSGYSGYQSDNSQDSQSVKTRTPSRSSKTIQKRRKAKMSRSSIQSLRNLVSGIFSPKVKPTSEAQ